MLSREAPRGGPLKRPVEGGYQGGAIPVAAPPISCYRHPDATSLADASDARDALRDALRGGGGMPGHGIAADLSLSLNDWLHVDWRLSWGCYLRCTEDSCDVRRRLRDAPSHEFPGGVGIL